MSQAASQAHAFYRDVAGTRRLWTVKDDDGYPMPKTADGKRAMPLWSSASRVEKIIRTVQAYAKFEPVELGWNEFRDIWLPDLEANGCLVGVNWSGPRALGYDIEPKVLRDAVEAQIEIQQPD